MKRFAPWTVALLAIVGVRAVAQQQPSAPEKPSSQSESGLVLRVTTRLVQVDTVVLDKEGRPVQGLTANDFTVTENGVRQRLTSFSGSVPEPVKPKAAPALPPHVATNRPMVMQANAESGTVAVLLLDGLNTPPESQIYVKQQMLKFLAREYDPNTRLAVVVLTDHLTVLQDFTQDPVLLRAALNRYLAKSPAVARAGGGTDTGTVSVPVVSVNLPPQATGGPNITGPDPSLPDTLSAGGSNDTIFADIAYMMDRFERESENFSQDTRISETLTALEQIARFMSAQQGRKVLMWFSTGFPFSVVGDTPSSMEAGRNYGDQIRRTINLLNDAHVATYTIDAGGLAPSSIGDVTQSGRAADGSIKHGIDVNRAMSHESFQRFSTHDALETIALDTGGRYFGDNDLGVAIQSALRESSSYYMLGYYPSNKKWDGKFRNIKVQVNRPGVQLRYRRGYFAVNPSDWKKQGENTLTSALKANSLPSTEVLFMSRAMPPAAGADAVVEFLVDPSTFSFEVQPGNLHYCSLRFEVQAFTPEGKLVKVEVQTAEAPLQPETYDRVRKQSLPMNVPIHLQPGKYILRLGVRDNRTGMFGTTDLPLEVPDNRASKH